MINIERLREVFDAACNLETDQQRHQFLDANCGSDHVLRERVEALLLADRDAGSFLHDDAQLDATIDSAFNSELIGAKVGMQIGPYKLCEQLAVGGMGVVYVAEQTEPVRRRVALKIIKPGMASKEVIARFEAERQALAMMEHPHIARIIDAGSTDLGQPFFVMELVYGLPITQYCDEQEMTTRERIQLFAKVCRAIQHAHQKGIIHRDIKPSNVLVADIDGRAVPKVIDFGVAKAVGPKLTDQTVYTQFSQMVGTPLYMSPEQANLGVQDIDTRSDVYSLGVLLYELLTGRTPIDRDTLKKHGMDEFRRMVREDEPPRPSAMVSTLQGQALSTVANRRKIEPLKLGGSLRGELDWIVIRALEKERERRYESASALAEDVERYLKNQPVEAGPPSFGYRFRKYARRHSAQLVTLTAVASLLVIGTLVSATLAAWAMREQRVARQNEEVANRRGAEAIHAGALAEKQSLLAKQQRDAAELDAYVASIQLVNRNWANGESRSGPLEALIPAAGRPDYRGWEWYYHLAQARSFRWEFPLQSTRGLHPIAWAPDGKQLASVDETGLVNIWDVITGQLKVSLDGHCSIHASLAWSPNGKYVADVSPKGVVIRDVEFTRVLRSFPEYSAVCVDWHPGSERIVTGGSDGAIKIWNISNGEILSTLSMDTEPVRCLDWHPDGTHLIAIGGPHGQELLKAWDTCSQDPLIQRGCRWGHSAAFSPDGSQLAFVSGINKFVTIDFPSNQTVETFTTDKGHVTSLSWNPSGQQIAVGMERGGVSIWDLDTKTQSTSIVAHSNVYTTYVAWSSDGQLLATTGSLEDSSDTLKVWDAAGLGDRAVTMVSNGNALAFSPDGRRLLAGNRMWDVASHDEVFALPVGTADFAWSPSGERFAADHGSRVTIYDAETGIPLPPTLPAGKVAWSPDGKTIALGSGTRRMGFWRNQVRLFDAWTGTEIATSSYATTPYGNSSVNCMAWSPDGRHLVASNPLRVWDAEFVKERIVARGAIDVDWSPNGQYLAAGHASGIAIYDTTSWMPVRVLEDHNWINSVAWHPWMARLATGDRQGTIRIWDTATGREVSRLDSDGMATAKVTWSPDGLCLASSGKGTICIWDGSSTADYLDQHGDLRAKTWGFAREKEYHKATEALRQLCTLHPDEKQLVVWRQRVQWLDAVSLAIEGRLPDATVIFEQLAARSSDVPDYRLQLPRRLFEAEMHDEAIALADRFVEESPQSLEQKNALAFLYESKVTQLCRAGEFEAAASLLRKLARKFPNRPDVRGQLAYEMAKTDQLEESIVTLAKLAEEFEGQPDYRAALARRLSAAGEHGLAGSVYQRIAEDHPETSEYRNLVRLESVDGLTRDGRLDEAKAILHELSEQSSTPEPRPDADTERVPDTPAATEIERVIAQLSDGLGKAYYGRATAAAIRGEFAEAVTNYESAIELVSDQAAFDNNFAWLLATTPVAENRDASRASALALKAVELDPEKMLSWNTLGVAQYRAGDFTAAITSLNKSLELDIDGTGFPSNAIFLAMVHWELGEQAEARSWFDKAQKWVNEHKSTDEELRRFQAEAEGILGENSKHSKVEDDDPPTTPNQLESDSSNKPCVTRCNRYQVTKQAGEVASPNTVLTGPHRRSARRKAAFILHADPTLNEDLRDELYKTNQLVAGGRSRPRLHADVVEFRW